MYQLNLSMKRQYISGLRIYINSRTTMGHTGVSRPRVIVNGRTVWSSSKGFGRFGRNCGGCSSIDSRVNYWLTMPFSAVTTSSISMQFNGADQRYDSMFILHEVQVEYA
jgi:hypothetical protein